MRLPVLLACALLPLAAFAQSSEAELMGQAQRAYLSGDDETAVTLFGEVLQTDPHNTLAVQYLRKIKLRHAQAQANPAARLGSVVLPDFTVRHAPFSDALEALKQAAAKQGGQVSFVSQLPPEQAGKIVTVSLSNIPFNEALRYLCSLNAATYRVEAYAIVITPAVAASPAPAQ